MKPQYRVRVFTGMRPTGDLTVANYMGAVAPVIEMQEAGMQPVVFVADLHALTDNEPSVAHKFTREVVADYIALGVDPDKTKIFLQSEIAAQVFTLTAILSRHVSVAELLRLPTLKDKLKGGDRPENANTLLLLYPVMMAADILLQRAEKVPVGEDQLAHMEVTRRLARSFNERYQEVFPIPEVQQVESLRILSLKGPGKMSKTSPSGAIFLTDDPEVAVRKIRAAQTAHTGTMTESLQSHILLARGLAQSQGQRDSITKLINAHMQGRPIMNEFKAEFASITREFLHQFQERRRKITQDPKYISSVLEEGAQLAQANADETLELVNKAIWKK